MLWCNKKTFLETPLIHICTGVRIVFLPPHHSYQKKNLFHLVSHHRKNLAHKSRNLSVHALGTTPSNYLVLKSFLGLSGFFWVVFFHHQEERLPSSLFACMHPLVWYGKWNANRKFAFLLFLFFLWKCQKKVEWQGGKGGGLQSAPLFPFPTSLHFCQISFFSFTDVATFVLCVLSKKNWTTPTFPTLSSSLFLPYTNFDTFVQNLTQFLCLIVPLEIAQKETICIFFWFGNQMKIWGHQRCVCFVEKTLKIFFSLFSFHRIFFSKSCTHNRYD